MPVGAVAVIVISFAGGGSRAPASDFGELQLGVAGMTDQRRCSEFWPPPLR